ncbi:MAG: hypothetical protein ACYDGX_10260 [Thermoleophilia bacterium]
MKKEQGNLPAIDLFIRAFFNKFRPLIERGIMKTSPLKSIRAKCLDCAAGSYKEVKLCPCTDCSLYPFRFGHNPARQGIGRKGGNPNNFKSEAITANSAND